MKDTDKDHQAIIHKIEATAQKTQLEITDDPVVLRTIVKEMIAALRGPDGRPATRERSLAVTKLQEVNFWLGEDMFVNPPAV